MHSFSSLLYRFRKKTTYLGYKNVTLLHIRARLVNLTRFYLRRIVSYKLLFNTNTAAIDFIEKLYSDYGSTSVPHIDLFEKTI